MVKFLGKPLDPQVSVNTIKYDNQEIASVNFTVLYHRDHNVPVLVVTKFEVVVTSSDAHPVCVCTYWYP